jgi:hypothetical protein
MRKGTKMNRIRTYIAAGVLLIALLLTQATAQMKLGDVIADAGCDWAIGKWAGDIEGEKIELEWKWALDKHVIIYNIKAGEYQSCGMIMYVASRDEVIDTSADNEGSTQTGKWRIEDNDAVLRFEKTDVRGQIEKSEAVLSKLDAETLKIALCQIDINGKREAEPLWMLTLTRQDDKDKPLRTDSIAQGYTLSGNLLKDGVNGKSANLKLVSQGGTPADEALYMTSAVFKGNKAFYSINGIKKGKYTVWLFIDANSNSGQTGPMPDAGDYAAMFDVDITKDTSRDVETWSGF